MPTGVGEEAGLSDVCVCTCGWVFACIMRISSMCVQKYICLFLWVWVWACVQVIGMQRRAAEDYTAINWYWKDEKISMKKCFDFKYCLNAEMLWGFVWFAIQPPHLCLPDVFQFRVSEATKWKMERQTKAGKCAESHGGGGEDDLEWKLQKEKKNPAQSRARGGSFCLLRLTCLVTQANEQQLDSSQLTLAIRLRPREMKRGGARNWEEEGEGGVHG